MVVSETNAPSNADNDAKFRLVRIWLAIVAACLSAFAAFGLSYQKWEPWLDEWLGEDSLVTSGAFELVGSLLISVPLLALFRAIGALGHDRGTIDSSGRIILRYRAGARRLHLGLCAALFMLFSAGAIILTTPEDFILRLACLVAAAFSFVAGYGIWTVKIIYDQTELVTPRFCRRPRRYLWTSLIGVSWEEAHNHFKLTFKRGRNVTISSSYAGVHDLMALAKRKSAQNAGTARG